MVSLLIIHDLCLINIAYICIVYAIASQCWYLGALSVSFLVRVEVRVPDFCRQTGVPIPSGDLKF